MNTLTINYTKSGKALADHETEQLLLEQAYLCVNGQDKQFNVSTSNAIEAVRALKVTDKITCDVKIMFEGVDIPMQKDGRINDWPSGFCDYTENWLCEIL